MLKKNSYKQWGIYRVGCSVMKSDWSDEVKWRKISDSSSKWMWSVLKAVVAGDVIEVAILEFDCALKLKVAVMGRRPSKRGVGLSFGGDVTKKFLEENNLDLVVRSHEVKDEGYEIDHDGKLITVFSAPNYCDQVISLSF